MIFNPLFLKNPIIDKGIFKYTAPALDQPKHVFADIVKYVLESEPESDITKSQNLENQKENQQGLTLESLLQNSTNSIVVDLPKNASFKEIITAIESNYLVEGEHFSISVDELYSLVVGMLKNSGVENSTPDKSDQLLKEKNEKELIDFPTIKETVGFIVEKLTGNEPVRLILKQSKKAVIVDLKPVEAEIELSGNKKHVGDITFVFDKNLNESLKTPPKEQISFYNNEISKEKEKIVQPEGETLNENTEQDVIKSGEKLIQSQHEDVLNESKKDNAGKKESFINIYDSALKINLTGELLNTKTAGISSKEGIEMEPNQVNQKELKELFTIHESVNKSIKEGGTNNTRVVQENLGVTNSGKEIVNNQSGGKIPGTEDLNPVIKTEKDLKEVLTTFEAIKSSIESGEKNKPGVKQETSEIINSENKSTFNDLVKKVDTSHDQALSNIKALKSETNPGELLSPSHNLSTNTVEESDISDKVHQGTQSDSNSIKFRLDDKILNTPAANPEIKTEKDPKEVLTAFKAIKSSIESNEKNQTAVKQETSEITNGENKSTFNDLVKKVDASHGQTLSNIKALKSETNPGELLSPSHNLSRTTVEDKDISKKGVPDTLSDNKSVISPKVVNSITNQLSSVKIKAAIEVIELNTSSPNIPKQVEGNDFFVTGRFIQNEIVIGYQSKSLNELLKNSREKEVAGLNEKPIQAEDKKVTFSFKPNPGTDISNNNLLFSTKRIPMLDVLGNNKVLNQVDNSNGKDSQTVVIYRNGETTYPGNSAGKGLFTSITSSLNALNSIDTNTIDVTGSRSIDLNALKNAVAQIVQQPKSVLESKFIGSSDLFTINEKNLLTSNNHINPGTIKSDKSIQQEQTPKISEKGLEPEAKFYNLKSSNGNDVQPKLNREVSTSTISESLKDDLKTLKETLLIKDTVSDLVKQSSGAREKVVFTKETNLNTKAFGDSSDNLVRKFESNERANSERLAGSERINDINQTFKRFIPTADESQSNLFVKTWKSGQSQNGFLETERENTVFRTKETVSIKANDGSIKEEVISSGKKEFVGVATRNEDRNPDGNNENRERQLTKNIIIKSDQKINTNNISNQSFESQINNETKTVNNSIREQSGQESISGFNSTTANLGETNVSTYKESDPFGFEPVIKNSDIFVANKGEVKAPFSNQPQIIKSFELIKELSSFIERREAGSMTFKVEPGDLGLVKISLSVVDDILTAMMEVESQEVKSLVENNINQLYQNLNQAGIQAAAVKVTINYNDGKNPKPNSNSKNKNSGKSPSRSDEEGLNVKSMGYNTYEYLI